MYIIIWYIVYVHIILIEAPLLPRHLSHVHMHGIHPIAIVSSSNVPQTVPQTFLKPVPQTFLKPMFLDPCSSNPFLKRSSNQPQIRFEQISQIPQNILPFGSIQFIPQTVLDQSKCGSSNQTLAAPHA